MPKLSERAHRCAGCYGVTSSLLPAMWSLDDNQPHEHARITLTMSLPLEAAGVGTARAWLALQTAFDLAQAQATADFTVRNLNPVA